MTRRFGIDTAILVRLLTGEPAAEFEYCVGKLSGLVQETAAEIFASNQVIEKPTSPCNITMGQPRPMRATAWWTFYAAGWSLP